MKGKEGEFNPPVGSLIEFRVNTDPIRKIVTPYAESIICHLAKQDDCEMLHEEFLGALTDDSSTIPNNLAAFFTSLEVGADANLALNKLKNCRFKWTLEDFEVFLIELPPQVRTVRIAGVRDRVAFPWIYCFIGFRRHRFYSFTAFYGKDRILSYESPMYFTNVPHGESTWPYGWCLGITDFAPSDKALWVDEVVGAFWERNWRYHTYDDMAKIFCSEAGLSRIHNMDGGLELTRERPQNILTLPWPKAPDAVGEFGAKVLIDNFLEGVEGVEHLNLRKIGRGSIAKQEVLTKKWVAALLKRAARTSNCVLPRKPRRNSRLSKRMMARVKDIEDSVIKIFKNPN